MLSHKASTSASTNNQNKLLESDADAFVVSQNTNKRLLTLRWFQFHDTLERHRLLTARELSTASYHYQHDGGDDGNGRPMDAMVAWRMIRRVGIRWNCDVDWRQSFVMKMRCSIWVIPSPKNLYLSMSVYSSPPCHPPSFELHFISRAIVRTQNACDSRDTVVARTHSTRIKDAEHHIIQQTHTVSLIYNKTLLCSTLQIYTLPAIKWFSTHIRIQRPARRTAHWTLTERNWEWKPHEQFYGSPFSLLSSPSSTSGFQLLYVCVCVYA